VQYDSCVKGVQVIAAKKRYVKGGAEYCKLRMVCAKGGKFVGGERWW
jgi:hypothetical protein